MRSRLFLACALGLLALLPAAVEARPIRAVYYGPRAYYVPTPVYYPAPVRVYYPTPVPIYYPAPYPASYVPADPSYYPATYSLYSTSYYAPVVRYGYAGPVIYRPYVVPAYSPYWPY